MGRTMLAVVLMVTAGCGISSTGGPIAKYDEVRDHTEVSATVRKVSFDGRNDVRASLLVALRGKGKHPTDWEASLSVVAFQPRGTPDVLGERPKLLFGPDVYRRSFESYRSKIDTDSKDLHVIVSFNMTIDDLIYLLDSPGKLDLDGKTIVLTDTEKEVIRQSIVAAREATNAGK